MLFMFQGKKEYSLDTKKFIYGYLDKHHEFKYAEI